MIDWQLIARDLIISIIIAYGTKVLFIAKIYGMIFVIMKSSKKMKENNTICSKGNFFFLKFKIVCA